MKELTLSPRLRAAAETVRQGARLVDVGTDHAYLPVYLAKRGRIEAALAGDIAEGPIRRAKETVSRFGCGGTVTVKTADGLAGAESFAPTDVVIAGMGGELIAEILEKAPFVKDEKVRLILQPMTKGEVLREYLAAQGFGIVEERLAVEGARIYTVIVCRYGGGSYELTPIEALIGPRVLENESEDAARLIEKNLKKLKKDAAGKERGGVLTEEERALIAALAKEKERREKTR